jgi:hypothetical protein
LYLFPSSPSPLAALLILYSLFLPNFQIYFYIMFGSVERERGEEKVRREGRGGEGKRGGGGLEWVVWMF